MPVLTCPTCGNEVLKEHEGRLKIRTRLLIRDPDGTVRGLCRNCGVELVLPMTIVIPGGPGLYVAGR